MAAVRASGSAAAHTAVTEVRAVTEILEPVLTASDLHRINTIAAVLARPGHAQGRGVLRDRVLVVVRHQIAGYAGRAARDVVKPRWLNACACDTFDKGQLLLRVTEGAHRFGH